MIEGIIFTDDNAERFGRDAVVFDIPVAQLSQRIAPCGVEEEKDAKPKDPYKIKGF